MNPMTKRLEGGLFWEPLVEVVISSIYISVSDHGKRFGIRSD
jgi:hypothetical protein